MESAPLVSLVVLAYNAPLLLERGLTSVYNQTYRPLEVIVMDDKSPQDLRPIVEKFAMRDDQITLRYFRNGVNLRPYWNAREGWSKVAGEYFIYFAHDDFYVSDEFIAEGVRALSEREKYAVFIGNSRIENSDETMMPGIPLELMAHDGRHFITSILWERAHPSYSSVIIRNSRLLEGGYDSLFFPRKIKEELDVEPDEYFACIALASLDREVLLTGEIFSVRGRPESSYSTSEFWRTRGNLGVIFSNFKLVQYFLAMREFRLAAFFASLATGISVPMSMNLPIIRYMGYSPTVASLLVFAIFRRLWERRAQPKILRIWRQMVSATGAVGPSAPRLLSLRILRLVGYLPIVASQMVFRASSRQFRRFKFKIMRKRSYFREKGSPS